MSNKLEFRQNKKYPNKLFKEVGECALQLCKTAKADETIEDLAKQLRMYILFLRMTKTYAQCKNITVRTTPKDWYKEPDSAATVMWIEKENILDNSVITIMDFRTK